MTLLEVAKRLNDPRLNRAVASFRESSVSLRRVALLLATVLWVGFWAQTDNPVLSAEASRVLPTVILFLALAIGWAVFIRRRPHVQEKEWVDLVGTSGDFIGIGVMIAQAFTLLIPYVIFLPLACITAGARYGRRTFYALIFTALLIVAVAAPAGYWESRPVVAVLAIALIGGLPLTVNRLLNGLRVMSEQAILESERALQATDARSRFLATMSHELRTPLNTVVHAATLIDPSPLPADERKLIELLDTNATVLLHRVNNVLDLAASEAGSLHVARDPFLVAQVFARLEKVVAYRAEVKRIALRFVGAEAIPEPLFGDSDRVEQVLTNLVTNALKHTPNGGSVVVSARRLSPAGFSPVRVEFAVADTGCGIADAEKPVVFQAFRKVGANRSREGIGLGLHIADAISRCLGGEFDLPHDNPGGGTVFTWRVPFEPCPPGTVVPDAVSSLDSIAAHRKRVPPMRCLVIDDQETNRVVFAGLLGRAGHSSIFADDGFTGIQAMERGEVDVVFLDMQMPGMSGMELLRTVQEAGFTAPPIVVVSAAAEREQVAEALALGAMTYLTKPLATSKILDVLERIQHATRPPGASDGAAA